MKLAIRICFLLLSLPLWLPAQTPKAGPRVNTIYGMLEGARATDGILVFKGIPYAAAPVGPLRWQEPQAPLSWKGIRQATQFGHKPLQTAVYSDMVSRADSMSEDCLYLNVWTAATGSKKAMPVLVYIHGGGLYAGDGSEFRYDGASMARLGIVTVTINYRLGIFGFLAHPALSKASPHHSSGNYGVLDQVAALQWVQQNIAAFGGDPRNITIAGQSAGAVSVTTLVATPLAKGLFHKAIAQSGSILGSRMPSTLRTEESKGGQLMQLTGAKDLEALRKLPAKELLALYGNEGTPRFGISTDGYLLPKDPREIFTYGQQADIPILSGWNNGETGSILGSAPHAPEQFEQTVQKLYGNRAATILALYPHKDSVETVQSAIDLATDRFAGYNTWKWIDMHSKTNGFPVYRYLFCRTAPSHPSAKGGALHSAEIPYAMGNLALVSGIQWTAADQQLSATMQLYFANFIKTGNPNGSNLPKWPGLQSSIPKVMVLDTNTRIENEKGLRRYLYFDQTNNAY
ncbi:MAG: carboxylesterase family protein [Candidatus Pseudobacter hemicellulosilyticus]|uniref:Carboxylic ester hydrolase n=1 Tax=Candidatus Pseudobacter hemicellulosilyticus TaxID=3121375 RepID=A0AAJ5WXL7_9BACT|nr:MAG: carboxylesterase family protein [Pseudobacter sp.]